MSKIFSNSAFELRSDAFIEGDRQATVDGEGVLTCADGGKIDTAVRGRFPRLSSDCPMLDAMYGIAVRDHERITIDPKTYFYMLCNRYGRDRKIPEGFVPSGGVFWAGWGFNTFLYTRDTAYSSWLGTSHILPDVAKSHLQYLRGLRREIGLKVSKRHEIPIEGLPFEQLDVTEREMSDKYNTNSYTRRTDDIVWVLGLWEVYKCTRDPELLPYIIEEFDYFDDHFYRYFLDEADGLYRAQATFIDVGGPCYPGRGPGRTVILKALSTNCLYAGCFSILQEVAALLGRDDRAEEFRKRRNRLAESIRRSFGGHGYPFYKDEEGNISDRREILGTAFLTIFDILPRAEWAGLMASYHDGDYGRPLVWPFYGSKQVYHDNSTWPFADTIFALAEYKVGNRQAAIRATMGKLSRAALEGNFNEVIEYATGKMVGCPGYIWSAASYLALVFKMIAGLEVDGTGKVTFAPVLPAELGDRLDLDGLRIGEMTLNLRVRGNGERVERCTIAGEEVDQPLLEVAAGERTVEIHLGGGEGGS